MALRLIDGFDYLPAASTVTTQMLKGRWYSAGSDTPLTASNTAFGYGNSLFYFGGYSNPSHLVTPIGVQTTFTVGKRVLVGAAHSAYGALTFVDAVNGITQFSVSWGQFGLIKVWRGAPGTGVLLISSAVGAVVDESWFFLEVQGTLGTSTGAVEVRVNTVPIITLVSANTKAGSRNAFDCVGIYASALPGFGGFVSFYVDDLYGLDGTGGVNTTFLGNARIKALPTIGAGGHTGLSIGGSAPAATNWQSVQNKELTDAQYVFSATAGDYDLYAIDPQVNAPTVFGLQARGSWRQDDATQRVSRNLLKISGGSLIEGADNYLYQTYAVHSDIYDLNPDTGLGWTQAQVNALQLGGKITV
jgi:hypothetical protein